MTPIQTPEGLEDYQPWGRILSDLKVKHPDLDIFETAIREADNVEFKAGKWVRLNDGKEIKIIGFDNYNYPIPIDSSDEPIGQFNNGHLQVTVYKPKYRKITRAIHAICMGYCFTDLEEYEWMPKS